jgi:hypothetical protein
LKGKGEPSYTFERERKERKAQKAPANQHTASSSANAVTYEMQPSRSSHSKDNVAQVRQRSASNEAKGPRVPPKDVNPFSDDYSTNPKINRSNTTGKSIAQTLKRRLGSLRRKKATDDADYY